jgi:hypothetical protein
MLRPLDMTELFNMQTTSKGKPASRREFIRKTAATAAVLAAAPALSRKVFGQAPAAGNVLGANNRITVGFIGVAVTKSIRTTKRLTVRV